MSKETKQIEVSKVTIKVAGKEISLTLEEARELRDILAEAFPDKQPQITKVVEHHDYHWPRPIWVDTTTAPAPKWDKWRITCEARGDNSVMCLAGK